MQLYSQSIVAYKTNDLNFGDVFIGYSENIDHTDPKAAKFYFYHTKFFFADVLITFDLPQNLSNGTDKLPIKFNYSHAAWGSRDATTNRQNFNPNTPIELRRLFFYRSTYIWLGGNIQTHTGLSPGNYNGTIILTIEFL